MPYCPNPECPFRKRFGESAEFRSEISTCSDCGSSLSEKDILGPVPKKEKPTYILADIYGRILWTLALVAFWRILSHMPLPGFNYDALARFGGGEDGPFAQLASIRLLSLGLTSYVSAYVLIEVLSLFVAPLKRWRVEGGTEGRAKLVRLARWTTLAIAIYHASALVSMMNGLGDGNFLSDNSLAFRSLLVLTLVAGLFLTVWIADMLSKQGIGHGISILFLLPHVGDLPHRVYKWLSALQGDNRIRQVVIAFLILAGLVMLIVVIERTVRRIAFRRSDGANVFVPIKLTTAGTIPAEVAGWIFGLPVLILSIFPAEKQSEQHVLQWLAGDPHYYSLWLIAIYVIVVVVLYYLFTAFFHNPRKIGAYVDRSENSGFLSPDGLRIFDRILEGMALVASFYLIMLAYAQDVLWALFGIPLVMDGLMLLLVVCITLDIVNEARLRWCAGDLVNIAEFHEPWKAGLMQNILKEKNIPSVIRGYHHRALLYFFGPYIEMSLYVPQEHAEAAQATLEDGFPPVATAGT